MEIFDGAPAPNEPMPMDEVEAIASAFDPTSSNTKSVIETNHHPRIMRLLECA